MAGADERGPAGDRDIEESTGARRDWVSAFEDAVAENVSIWWLGVEGMALNPNDSADDYVAQCDASH